MVTPVSELGNDRHAQKGKAANGCLPVNTAKCFKRWLTLTYRNAALLLKVLQWEHHRHNWLLTKPQQHKYNMILHPVTSLWFLQNRHWLESSSSPRQTTAARPLLASKICLTLSEPSLHSSFSTLPGPNRELAQDQVHTPPFGTQVQPFLLWPPSGVTPVITLSTFFSAPIRFVTTDLLVIYSMLLLIPYFSFIFSVLHLSCLLVHLGDSV